MKRMLKVVIANSKGGVGKSTIAACLVDSLPGSQIVETDVQGSIQGAARFGGRHQSVSVKEAKKETLIFDTPAYLSKELLPLFREADVVLIPTRLSLFDIVALGGVLSMVERARARDKTFIVPAQVPSPSRLTRGQREAMDCLRQSYSPYKKTKAVIGQMASFQAISSRPLSGRGKAQVEGLLEEVGLL